MLTDTGPILAMLDRGDERHEEVLALVNSFPRGPFITTLPCFTEMMHLLGRRVGSRGQERSGSSDAAGACSSST